MLADEEVTANAAAEESQAARIERYEIRGRRLERGVQSNNGTWHYTDFGPAPARGKTPGELHALADLRYLQAKQLPSDSEGSDSVVIADLFGGIGALTLGVMEAARAVGRSGKLVLAADNDLAPLQVLRETLGVGEKVARQIDLGEALNGTTAERTEAEAELLGKKRKKLDILVAGPPCQGHSRLNNHTRHDDPRNDLYGRVSRFVDLERPRLVVIENVDSVVNDQRRSALDAADALRRIGYQVDEERVSLHQLGVPQKRRRHVLVATRSDQRKLSVADIVERYAVAEPEGRNLRWAIGDLERLDEEFGFDTPSNPSGDNEARIRWLHGADDRYDLPNPRRPDCHRDFDSEGEPQTHSYRSMYGKLNWAKPAQTITSGYGSMGQGRYVHPSKLRTITPHEAARLQFIPDFVAFDAVEGRGKWARMIGNVAPMKLSYVFALEFLR
jgi:DNA (cytosine-5)-methyltransferase 1